MWRTITKTNDTDSTTQDCRTGTRYVERKIPQIKPGNNRLQENIKGPKATAHVGQCRYCSKQTNKQIQGIYVCDSCWIKVPKKIYI